jgi:hypothetical protein
MRQGEEGGAWLLVLANQRRGGGHRGTQRVAVSGARTRGGEPLRPVGRVRTGTDEAAH